MRIQGYCYIISFYFLASFEFFLKKLWHMCVTRESKNKNFKERRFVNMTIHYSHYASDKISILFLGNESYICIFLCKPDFTWITRGIFCFPFYFSPAGLSRCITLSSIGKSLDVSSFAVEMPYSYECVFARGATSRSAGQSDYRIVLLLRQLIKPSYIQTNWF